MAKPRPPVSLTVGPHDVWPWRGGGVWGWEWRERGLRAQTQIVLSGGGGSGNCFLLVQRRAPWEGEKKRRPHNGLGMRWRAGVTEWMEDVRQWMSGGWRKRVVEVLLTESDTSGCIPKWSASSWSFPQSFWQPVPAHLYSFVRAQSKGRHKSRNGSLLLPLFNSAESRAKQCFIIWDYIIRRLFFVGNIYQKCSL